MSKKHATIGFGDGYAKYYTQFDTLTKALRFMSSYDDETPIYNLMYDGDEYFHPTEHIEKIARENCVNV